MIRRRLSIAALLLFATSIAAGSIGGILLWPEVASAQGVDSQIESLVQQSEDQYGNLELQAAEQSLQRAIELGDRRNATGSVVAEAWVMMGVVRYGSTRSKSKARKAFRKAAELDRTVGIPSSYKTPTLTKIMKSVKSKLPDPKTGGSEEDGPRRVDSFTHSPISSAQAGKPLEVEAFVPSDMPVARVYMLFKRYDQSSFEQQVELKPTSATRFAAEVEGYRIYTSQIAYYLEAVDQSGNVIARSGSKSSPHSMTVLGSASFDAEKARRMAMKDRKSDKQNEGSGGKTQTPPPEEGRDRDLGGSGDRDTAYISLGPGTGVGFLTGGTPTANPGNTDRINPGLAPAFAHVWLGGGWMITPTSHLGLSLRWQFSPAQNFDAIRARHPDKLGQYTGFTNGECLGTGIPGDCTIGIKYRWIFAETPGLDAFSSIGAGFGRLRHWLRLQQRADSAFCQQSGKPIISNPRGTDYCYRRDTVRPGWVHLGVGGGIAWNISEVVSFYGEGYLQVLFPETAINVDVNVGPMFTF